MAKKPKITTRGALLVVDLEAVDRAWGVLPAREVVDGLRTGALAPRPPRHEPPMPPAEKKTQGLDVALAGFTSRKLLDRPIAEGLRAKRALGAPWRWFARVPDEKEERRADERLLRWAEIARVPELTADEILAVTSAVEREMIGASEVKVAFGRWGSPEFAARIERLADADVPAALSEAWSNDLAPLLAALGYDEEEELFAAVRARVTQVRALHAFAKAEGYPVIPYLKDRWDELLAERARSRAGG